MANDNVQKAINSPIPSILKESIMTSIQMEISREVAEKKILQAAIIQSKIKKTVDGQRFMLAQISKDRQDEVNEANAKLDKRMILLQQQVTELVNLIQLDIQNIDNLTDEYISPLSNNIKDAISPIRESMQATIRDMMDNDNISQAFQKMADVIGFDLKNYVHDEDKEVDFLKLARDPELDINDLRDFNVLCDLCELNSDRLEFAGLSAAINKLKITPDNSEIINEFMTSFTGTEFIANARVDVQKARQVAIKEAKKFEVATGKSLAEVEISMQSSRSNLQTRVNQLSGIELKCKQMSVEVMKPFNWQGAMSHSKVNAELKMGLHHKSQELEVDDEIIPSAPKIR